MTQARQTAEDELGATGSSKVRFSVESKENEAASSPISVHDRGQRHLSFLTFCTFVCITMCFVSSLDSLLALPYVTVTRYLKVFPIHSLH